MKYFLTGGIFYVCRGRNADIYIRFYNVSANIYVAYIQARARVENLCPVNPVYGGGSMRFETETLAVYRDGGEDRVSFHSLKGHRNAIVLSLENITGETIRDGCVLAIRIASNGMTPLCKLESQRSDVVRPIEECLANRLRNVPEKGSTCTSQFSKERRSFNRLLSYRSLLME